MDIQHPDLAIRDAHWVCGLFDQGATQVQAVTAEQQRVSLSDEGAMDFVAAAVTAYCPQYRPKEDQPRQRRSRLRSRPVVQDGGPRPPHSHSPVLSASAWVMLVPGVVGPASTLRGRCHGQTRA